MEPQKQQNIFNNLILLSKWEEEIGCFTTRQLRYFVFTNLDNFEEVLVRINKRIYICKDSFVEWLRKTNPKWNYLYEKCAEKINGGE